MPEEYSRELDGARDITHVVSFLMQRRCQARIESGADPNCRPQHDARKTTLAIGALPSSLSSASDT
jgi:hypothetical protein